MLSKIQGYVHCICDAWQLQIHIKMVMSTDSFDKYGSDLIFIISLPRSGSTMLQHILGGHPDILALPEPWLMLHPLYALRRSGVTADYEAEQARCALDAFLDNMGGEDVYYEAVRSMASVLYGSALQRYNKSCFLDKTPRYYNIIPELYRLFPGAKFVFLSRNPLAILSSVLKTWFKNDLNELMGTANQQDMEMGPRLLLEGIRLLGDDAIVMRYEDLVTSPGTSVHALCSSIGLKFYPEMLDYTGNIHLQSRFGDQTGIHQYAGPVTDSIDKWIDNLTSKELVKFSWDYLDFLGDELLGELGYEFQELRKKLLGIASGAVE